MNLNYQFKLVITLILIVANYIMVITAPIAANLELGDNRYPQIPSSSG